VQEYCSLTCSDAEMAFAPDRRRDSPETPFEGVREPNGIPSDRGCRSRCDVYAVLEGYSPRDEKSGGNRDIAP